MMTIAAALERLVGRRDAQTIGQEIAEVQAALARADADEQAARHKAGMLDRHQRTAPIGDSVAFKAKLDAARAEVDAVRERMIGLNRQLAILHRELDVFHYQKKIRAALCGRVLPVPPNAPESGDDIAKLRIQLRGCLAQLAEKLRDAAILNEEACAIAGALRVSSLDELEPWPELRVLVSDSRFMLWITRAIKLGIVDVGSER